ncbi:MAG: TSUP family transporter [Faecousia sp.]
MLESLPAALIVGTVLGFLTGLGVGGGSLLILWLTLVLEIQQQTARGINLLFFLPSAAISCYFRWKQGTVKLKRILPAIIAGCIAAGVFSFIGARMDLELLKKLFGILLIVTGIRELCYRPKPIT